MKAIMISIKPKWYALILNGIKKGEVRKGTALYKAINKLIEQYGYAEIYMYCTKGKPNLWLPYEYDCFELDEASQPYLSDKPILDVDTKINGKVVAKFRCYKVEEIMISGCYEDLSFGKGKLIESYITKSLDEQSLLEESCLIEEELDEYLDGKNGTYIHISDLEIFDKPRELSEFRNAFKYKRVERVFGNNNVDEDKRTGGLRQPVKGGYEYVYPLTKAPQSFCYIETEE